MITISYLFLGESTFFHIIPYPTPPIRTRTFLPSLFIADILEPFQLTRDVISRLVRESIPEAVIGLFVHTPFPSSEVFRCLPSWYLFVFFFIVCNRISSGLFDVAWRLQ